MYNRNDKINYDTKFNTAANSLLGTAAALGFTGAVGTGAYLVLNSGMARNISNRILAANNITTLAASFKSGTAAAKSNSRAMLTEEQMRPHIKQLNKYIKETTDRQINKKLIATATEQQKANEIHAEDLPKNMNAIQYQVTTAKMREAYKINRRIENRINSGKNISKIYKRIGDTTPRAKPIYGFANNNNAIKATQIYKKTQDALKFIDETTGASRWAASVDRIKGTVNALLNNLNSKRNRTDIKTEQALNREMTGIYNEVSFISGNVSKVSDLILSLEIGVNPTYKDWDKFSGLINKKMIDRLQHNSRITAQLTEQYSNIEQSINALIGRINNIKNKQPTGANVTAYEQLKVQLNEFKAHLENQIGSKEKVETTWNKLYTTATEGLSPNEHLEKNELIDALEEVQKSANENKAIKISTTTGSSVIHPAILPLTEAQNASAEVHGIDKYVKIRRLKRNYNAYKEAQRFYEKSRSGGFVSQREANRLGAVNEHQISVVTEEGVQDIPSTFSTLSNTQTEFFYNAKHKLDKDAVEYAERVGYNTNSQYNRVKRYIDTHHPAEAAVLREAKMLDVNTLDTTVSKKTIKQKIAIRAHKANLLFSPITPYKLESRVSIENVKSMSPTIGNIRRMQNTVGGTISEKIDNAIADSMRYTFKNLNRTNAAFIARFYGHSADSALALNELNSNTNLKMGIDFNRASNRVDALVRKFTKPKSTKSIIKKVTTMFNKLGVNDDDIKIRTNGEQIILSGKLLGENGVRDKNLNFSMNLTDGNIHFSNGNILVTRNVARAVGENNKTLQISNVIDEALNVADSNLSGYYKKKGSGFSAGDITKIHQTLNMSRNKVLNSSINVTNFSYRNKVSSIGLTQDSKIRYAINKIDSNYNSIMQKKLQLKSLQARVRQLDREGLNNMSMSYVEERNTLESNIFKLEAETKEYKMELSKVSTIADSAMNSSPTRISGVFGNHSLNNLYQVLHGILKPNIASVSNRLIPKGIGNLLYPFEPGYNIAKGIHSIRNAQANPLAAYRNVDDLDKLHLPNSVKQTLEQYRDNRETRATIGIAPMELFENPKGNNYIGQDAEVYLNHVLVNSRNGGDIITISESAAKKMAGSVEQVTTLNKTTMFGRDLNDTVHKLIDINSTKDANKITITRAALANDAQGKKLLGVLENTISFNSDTDFSSSKKFLDKNKIEYKIENGKVSISENGRAKLYDIWNEESTKAFRRNVHQEAFKDTAISKITINEDGIKIYRTVTSMPGFNSKSRDPMGVKAMTRVVPDDVLYEMIADARGLAANSTNRINFIKQLKASKVESFSSGKINNSAAINLSLLNATVDFAKDEITKQLKSSGVSNVDRHLNHKLRMIVAALLDPEDMMGNDGNKILNKNKIDSNIKPIQDLGQDITKVIPSLTEEKLEQLLRTVGSSENTSIAKNFLERLLIITKNGTTINTQYVDTKIYNKAKTLGVFTNLHISGDSTKEKQFLHDIISKLTVNTGNDQLLVTQKQLKHTAESNTNLFRMATGDVRALGGVKNGVQVDMMSTMFLRMKGMDNLANRVTHMAATGRNAVQMYMANLLEMFGDDPKDYLGADVLDKLGLSSTTAKHLILPGGHVGTISHIDTKQALLDRSSANLTSGDKYQFLITGTGFRENREAQEIGQHVDDLLSGIGVEQEGSPGMAVLNIGHDRRSLTEQDVNDVSDRVRDTFKERSTIELVDTDFTGTVESQAKALKDKLRSVNKMSSLLTKEELESYRKFLKANKKIKLPPGMNVVNTINNESQDYVTMLDFVMGTHEEIGFDYTKLNIHSGGKSLYALNDVHMAQVKLNRLLGISAELEQFKIKNPNTHVNINDTKRELEEKIENALNYLYVAKLHTTQVVFRSQWKPRVNGFQAIGHPEFVMNQSKLERYEINDTSAYNLFEKNNIIKKTTGGKIATISPKIGFAGMDSGIFVQLLQNQSEISQEDAGKVANLIMGGKISTFVYNKREPVLSQNSYQGLKLQLYNMEQLIGSATDKEKIELKEKKEAVFLHRFTAGEVEGDFDRDIYSLMFSLANGTYFDEQQDILSSYVKDHAMHIEMKAADKYGVETANGKYVKHVFDANKSGFTGIKMFSNIKDYSIDMLGGSKINGHTFQFLTKDTNEALKTSLITVNDKVNEEFAKTYGLTSIDDLHKTGDLTPDVREFLGIIDKEGLRNGKYTKQKLIEKLENQKRSLAKDLFGFSDDQLDKLKAKDTVDTKDGIEGELSKVYMIDTSKEYYNKVDDYISKDLKTSSDKITGAFNAFNIKNAITDNLEPDVAKYFAANTDASSGDINELLNTMKKEYAITSGKIAKSNKTIGAESVNAFVRIKQATGLIYDFVHGAVDTAAVDLFGARSKTANIISRLGWVPEQINISAKHMLPSIAIGWMESVKLAAKGGEESQKIIHNLTEGKYNLTDFFDTNNILKENRGKINTVKRFLKDNEGDSAFDDLRNKVDRWESNSINHNKKLRSYVDAKDRSSDLREFTTNDLLQSYQDRLELNETMHAQLQNKKFLEFINKDEHVKENGGFFTGDYTKENEYLNTVIGGIKEGQDFTKQILNTKEKQDMLNNYFTELTHTGGLNNYVSKSLTQLLSNRTMRFSDEGVVKGLYSLIVNKTGSFFGDLFSAVSGTKTKRHINPEDASKFMDDSLIHKMTAKVDAMADTGITKRILNKIDASDIVEHGRIKKGGMAGAFMGALFGVVAAIGASSSKRRWLGHQTGVGGEAYDNNGGRNERWLSDKTTANPEIANLKETFNPSSGMMFRHRAMLRDTLLAKPRKSSSQQFKEIMFGDRDFMFSAQRLGTPGQSQSYSF